MRLCKRTSILSAASAVIISGILIGCGSEDNVNLPEASQSSSPGYSQTDIHEWYLSSTEAFTRWEATEGALIIDVRSEAEFSERHVSVAINIQYDGIVDYAAKNISEKDTLIITYCFCGGMGGPALTARNLLAEMGYTNVYYTDPEDEWDYEGTSNAIQRIISGAEAKQIIAENDTAILLDVRSQEEYDTGNIENSILIPVAELSSRLSELPDKEAIIIVYCKAGMRSATAYEILVNNGYTNVYDMQMIDNWYN